MSPGQRATLFGAVFLATIAVSMWAVTLPAPSGAFFLGMGWTLVLLAIVKWEDSLDGQITASSPAVMRWPRPFTSDQVGQAREDYRLHHDVRDLATLPCRYGCKEPVTCPFTHVDCPHCIGARERAATAGLQALAAEPDGR